MKPEPPQIAALSAMIGRDLDAIERLNVELAPLSSEPDDPTPAFRGLAAIVYILHNIYGAQPAPGNLGCYVSLWV